MIQGLQELRRELIDAQQARKPCAMYQQRVTAFYKQVTGSYCPLLLDKYADFHLALDALEKAELESRFA